MPVEENMALARRFIEARVKGDLDAMDEMMAPDFVSHSKLLPGQEPGREDEKWATAQLSAAVSNASVLAEDQVAAGDKVVTRFIVRPTHDRGELMGVAPTGRELTNNVIVIHRISGGKIAEEWSMGTMGSKLRGQLRWARARMAIGVGPGLCRVRTSENSIRLGSRVNRGGSLMA
jgi:predicted ester cyclase